MLLVDALGERGREPALADPGLAREQAQARTAGDRARPVVAQRGERVAAADEGALRRRLQRCRERRRERERDRAIASGASSCRAATTTAADGRSSGSLLSRRRISSAMASGSAGASVRGSGGAVCTCCQQDRRPGRRRTACARRPSRTASRPPRTGRRAHRRRCARSAPVPCRAASDEVAGRRQLRRAVHPHHAEVRQQRRVGAGQQHVARLDVAMDHAVLVGERERLGDVARDPQRERERQPLGRVASRPATEPPSTSSRTT